MHHTSKTAIIDKLPMLESLFKKPRHLPAIGDMNAVQSRPVVQEQPGLSFFGKGSEHIAEAGVINIAGVMTHVCKPITLWRFVCLPFAI